MWSGAFTWRPARALSLVLHLLLHNNKVFALCCFPPVSDYNVIDAAGPPRSHHAIAAPSLPIQLAGISSGGYEPRL